MLQKLGDYPTVFLSPFLPPLSIEFSLNNFNIYKTCFNINKKRIAHFIRLHFNKYIPSYANNYAYATSDVSVFFPFCVKI